MTPDDWKKLAAEYVGKKASAETARLVEEAFLAGAKAAAKHVDNSASYEIGMRRAFEAVKALESLT